MKLIDCNKAKKAMVQAFQEDVDRYGVEIPECFDADRACKILDELPECRSINGYDINYITIFLEAYVSHSMTPEDVRKIAHDFIAATNLIGFIIKHSWPDNGGDAE